MKKKAQRRSAATLKTLDSFLQEEGKLQEFETVAVRETGVCSTKTETIYIYLPEELVEVWAPADAEHVHGDVYRIVDCRGEDDEMEFKAGMFVRCRHRTLLAGVDETVCLVAYEKAEH